MSTRYRIEDGGKTYFVYATERAAAISVFSKAMGHDPSGTTAIDDQPWETKLHEGRRAPGA